MGQMGYSPSRLQHARPAHADLSSVRLISAGSETGPDKQGMVGLFRLKHNPYVGEAPVHLHIEKRIVVTIPVMTVAIGMSGGDGIFFA